MKPTPELPTTDEEAEKYIEWIVPTSPHKEAAISLFQIWRKLGLSVLDAYAKVLMDILGYPHEKNVEQLLKEHED